MTKDSILPTIKQLQINEHVSYLNDNEKETYKGAIGTEKQVEDKSEFSAEAFVKTLFIEGAAIPWAVVSHSRMELPPYYNEEMFKKGQKFFYKHIFGIFISNLFGLLLFLSAPAADVLLATKKTNTPMTAYRRYLATLFHVCCWYDGDFKPGSSLWSSICKVRKVHTSASNRSNRCINYRITQRDMAVTVFGFIGYALIRSKMVGIHSAIEDEWKNFIHLWRVIGYVVGVEERFNICRDSVQETRDICHFINKEFISIMENRENEKFDQSSRTMVSALQPMMPFLDYDALLFYLYMILENTSDTNMIEKKLKPLNQHSMSYFIMGVRVIWMLQYNLIRICFKYIILVQLWVLKVCPIIAYYRFGIRNSHVKI